MKFTSTLLALVSLSLPISASPVDRHEAQKRTLSGIGCYGCSAGPWTSAAQCTNIGVSSLISSLNNPPATIRFDAKDFCSHYLQPYTYEIFTDVITKIWTDVSGETVQATTTRTDFSQPTVSIYCPIKNDDATCGISADAVDPTAMQQDWEHSVPVGSAEACHQTCLSLSHCKSYRVSEYINPKGTWSCSIFRVALGKNGKNVPGGRPGNEYFDRDCQENRPAACGQQKRALHGEVLSPAAVARDPAEAVITPAPAIKDTEVPVQGQGWTLPDYISSTWGFDIGPYYIYEACSCLITSPLPMFKAPSTVRSNSYTATVKTTTTTTRVQTFYTAVHQTTVYTSIS